MRKGICSLCLMALSMLCGARTVTIADNSDKAPVACASVISSNGLIIGFTDNHGSISVKNTDYPLSVRSLGYESVTVEIDSDTIFLNPATYTLSEVVITPTDRPITRAIAYAREYCTGATSTDTMQMYNEYMLEFFYADGKVKGYDKSGTMPKPRNIRRYGRLSNSQGLDSIMRPKSDDDITALSFLFSIARMPSEAEAEPESLRSGAVLDTANGKYYPKFIYRKSNGLFSIECDALADHKEHRWNPWFFKLLGLTMEMQQAKWFTAYKLNDTGTYGLRDFIYRTFNVHINGKGKLLKKLLGIKDTIGIDCYVELYPVEIERLSVEEYKEAKEETALEEFRVPANAEPLPPYIDELVGRIDREIPIKKR